jgi:hypothetical protein
MALADGSEHFLLEYQPAMGIRKCFLFASINQAKEIISVIWACQGNYFRDLGPPCGFERYS